MLKKIVKIYYKKLIIIFYNTIFFKIKNFQNPNKKNFQLQKIKIKKNLKNLYLIDNCRIYTDSINNAAYISNNKILNGPSYQIKNNLNQNIKKNIVFKIGTPRNLKKFYGTALSLISGGAPNNNYFHFLFDAVSRIGILEKQIKNLKKIDYFYVPDIKYKYQREILQILNIYKKSITSKKNKHIYFDKVYATNHPWQNTNNPAKDIERIPKWLIIWLRKKFIKHKSKCQIFKKIYIDRSDSNFNNRKITNYEEIKQLLTLHNFKIIKLTKYKFSEQINIFENAKIIVANHGAGLTNIIFCKKNTKIIELRSPLTRKIYQNIGKILNLKYNYIIGKFKNKKFNDQNSEISIDLKKLKKLIYIS